MPVDDDILSPPYPSDGISADGLYQILKELKKWVNKYRDAHNKEIGQELIPLVKDLPDKKAYIGQPIMTQWGHLLLLRRIRESWDDLIRNYESDWDDKLCIRHRVLMLQSAAILLNNAFMPYEHREARQQRELEEMQNMFTRIQQVLFKQLESVKNDPNPET